MVGTGFEPIPTDIPAYGLPSFNTIIKFFFWIYCPTDGVNYNSILTALKPKEKVLKLTLKLILRYKR